MDTEHNIQVVIVEVGPTVRRWITSRQISEVGTFYIRRHFIHKAEPDNLAEIDAASKQILLATYRLPGITEAAISYFQLELTGQEYVVDWSKVESEVNELLIRQLNVSLDIRRVKAGWWQRCRQALRQKPQLPNQGRKLWPPGRISRKADPMALLEAAFNTSADRSSEPLIEMGDPQLIE